MAPTYTTSTVVTGFDFLGYQTGTAITQTDQLTLGPATVSGGGGGAVVAPAAPTITGLTSGTDSGTFGDNRTDDTTPAIYGTAPDNSVVSIYLDGSGTVSAGTVSAGSNGAWTYSFGSPLSVAGHTITATDTLSANLSTVSAGYSLTIDPVPSAPTVSGLTSATDTGVSSTDGITKDTTVGAHGTGTNGDTINVYVDGGSSSAGTATVSSGTWSITSLADTVSGGSHTLTATETDTHGNVSSLSSAYDFAVDTTAPTISSISASGATDDAIHASDTLTLTVHTSENVTVTGSPELSLNNGQTASYVSGSGSSTLVFHYTAAVGQYASDLHVTGLSLNGGTVTDTAGNALSGGATLDAGVSVDAGLPTLSVSGSSSYALAGGAAITVLSGAPTIGDADGSGTFAHATVSIESAHTGDALSLSGAIDGSATIDGASFTVTGEGTSSLTITGASTAAQYEAALQAVQYTDGATDDSSGSHPSRTLDFTVTNSSGDGSLTSDTANATIDIDRAPSVPDTADTATVAENGTVTGTGGLAGTGALAGDSDADNDTLTITEAGGDTVSGATNVTGTYGELTISSDGSYSYAANDTAAIDGAANGSHPVDSFTLTVDDGHGGTNSETLSFTIDRAPTVTDQSLPVAAADTVTATADNGALFGDSDPDGGTLAVSAVTPSGGTSAAVASTGVTTFSGTFGDLSLGADGHYTYTAGATLAEQQALASAATGSHPADSFALTVSDGGSATASEALTFDIDRAPPAPSDNDATANTVAEGATVGTAVGITALSTDPDGDTVAYSLSNDTSDGGFAVNDSTGVVTVADPTKVDYESGGSNHSYSVDVTASDGTLSNTQSFTIAVTDVAPAIAGAQAAQTTTDKADISPFSNVSITETGSATQEEAVTVTLSNAANGAFTADSLATSGFVADTITAGQYDYTGTATQDTAAIAGLVFQPTANQVAPADTVTTTFAIQVGDGTDSASDNSTTVITTSVNDPPTITGAVAGQTVLDTGVLRPFSGVTIGDPDVDQTETVSVTPSSIDNGKFSDLGSGVVNSAGVYTVSGSTAAVTAAVDQLVFTPTIHQVAGGQTITTGFTITATDGIATVNDSTTTVVVKDTPPPPTDIATPGNDTLTAASGGDTILGLAGDDTITGGTGHDMLYGNTGNDVITLLSYTDASTVYGGQGDDVIDARRSSVDNFLSGDLGNDSILGGAGDDTLYGGGGDDTLIAGSGSDQLYGNTGNDMIILGAASGSATVYGGQGNDVIDASASTHSNFISGDLGNDTIKLGAGADTAYGGDGDDTLYAGSGHDQLYGNAGNDTIKLNASTLGSTIYGGQGNDVIDASASTHANYISGDLGNDYILAGSGGDTIHGGAGSDTIQASTSGITFIHVGLADSSATSPTDASQLDHILNFNSRTELVFDGDPAGTSANILRHGGDGTIANYAAAYAYAYGGGGHVAAISGAVEYAVVGDVAGHVYVFAADHAAVELDGLSGNVSAVTSGQLLAV